MRTYRAVVLLSKNKVAVCLLAKFPYRWEQTRRAVPHLSPAEAPLSRDRMFRDLLYDLIELIGYGWYGDPVFTTSALAELN